MTEKLDKLYEEAERYTTVEEAMKKVNFAKTAYDHLVVGGTPPDPRMIDNPHRLLAEIMSEEEIEKIIERRLDSLVIGRYTREVINRELEEAVQRRDTFNYGARQILYLHEIGRLPARYQHFIQTNKSNEVKEK